MSAFFENNARNENGLTARALNGFRCSFGKVSVKQNPRRNVTAPESNPITMELEIKIKPGEHHLLSASNLYIHLILPSETSNPFNQYPKRLSPANRNFFSGE
jgi:hypothetical protein